MATPQQPSARGRAEREAEAVRRLLPELRKLNRYEARTCAMRDRALWSSLAHNATRLHRTKPIPPEIQRPLVGRCSRWRLAVPLRRDQRIDAIAAQKSIITELRRRTETMTGVRKVFAVQILRICRGHFDDSGKTNPIFYNEINASPPTSRLGLLGLGLSGFAS